MTSAERPLVTFALFAYNQERYIREAVEGAFSQTYSPLEIILSDDASTDLTFTIIKEMAASYDGPHNVVVNCNQNNLGIGKHVSKVMNLARGELIVMAAGDALSLNQRTSRLVDRWLESGFPSGIGSGIIEINCNGEQTGYSRGFGPFDPKIYTSLSKDEQLKMWTITRQAVIIGCCAAWSKEVIKFFGDLPEDVVCEDGIFTLRSCMLNGISIIGDNLVKYRRHESNIWSTASHQPRTAFEYRDYELKISRQAAISIGSIKAALKDVEQAIENGTISLSAGDYLKKIINLSLQRAELISTWWGIGLFEKMKKRDLLPDKSLLLFCISLFPLQIATLLRSGFARIKRYFS